MGTTPNVAHLSGPPQPTKTQTQAPTVRFQTNNVPPTQYLYFQQNDLITFFTITNLVGNFLNVNYRYLTPEGEIKEGRKVFPNVDTQTVNAMPFLEGWLLSVGLQSGLNLNPNGFLFVQVGFTRGFASAPVGPLQGMIWEGYVPFQGQTGFPGTLSQRVGDSPGIIRSLLGTIPAAGAEINELVVPSRRWTLLSLFAQLTTSATVANRFPGFRILDGANTDFLIHSSVAQTAGLVNRYNTAPGSPFYNDGQNVFVLPFPVNIQLHSPYRLQTDTPGLQAGDQWSAPTYLFQEWANWDTT